MNYKQLVLEDAINAVCGARNDSHGEAMENMAMIASFWNTYLGLTTIRPEDVPAMMALQKLARHKSGNGENLDNAIDTAGYAAILGECIWRKIEGTNKVGPPTSTQLKLEEVSSTAHAEVETFRGPYRC